MFLAYILRLFLNIYGGKQTRNLLAYPNPRDVAAIREEAKRILSEVPEHAKKIRRLKALKRTIAKAKRRLREEQDITTIREKTEKNSKIKELKEKIGNLNATLSNQIGSMTIHSQEQIDSIRQSAENPSSKINELPVFWNKHEANKKIALSETNVCMPTTFSKIDYEPYDDNPNITILLKPMNPHDEHALKVNSKAAKLLQAYLDIE